MTYWEKGKLKTETRFKNDEKGGLYDLWFKLENEGAKIILKEQ